MTRTNRPPATDSRPWSNGLTMGLWLCTTLSLVDLVAVASAAGIQPASNLALLAPPAFFCALLLVGYGGVWLGIYVVLGVSRMDRRATTGCAAAAVGVPISACLASLLDLPSSGARVWPWALLTVLACVAAYRAARGWTPRPAVWFRVALSVPFALAAAFLGLWVSGRTVAAIGALLLVGGFTLVALLSRRPGIALGTLALLLALAPLSALKGEARIEKPVALNAAPPRHVFLLTIDTLRRDALAAYGGAWSTPNLDALAADSVVFDRAYAEGPWTVPSFSSLMTGTTPWVHKVEEKGQTFSTALPTLAERMKAAGYRTVAVGKNYFLTKQGSRGTMPRGFERYEFYGALHEPMTLATKLLLKVSPYAFRIDADPDRLTLRAQRLVTDLREHRLFFWLHYYDPHDPYEPPLEFFPVGTPHPAIGDRFYEEVWQLRRGSLKATPEMIDWVRELYQGEVRYVDERIGRFVDTLRREGIYEESLIVFASDHGDEFWEHRDVGHSHTLYDELLRVPLMVKLPGATTSLRVERRVGLTSIVPTILDLAGIAFDVEDFSSRSLTRFWDDETSLPDDDDDAIFSTGMFLYEDREAVVFDHYKYIRFRDWPRAELYDLDADPGEQSNLVFQETDVVARARELLLEHDRSSRLLRARYGITSTDEFELTEEEVKKLNSLGYVQ